MSANKAKTSLSVDLCGFELEHPVLNGSGTFDLPAAVETFGESVIEDFPFSCFVSKTITMEQRTGNPPPRLFEIASGLINSIGLPNKGLEGFITSDLPRLAELPVPLMVSVAGFSCDEFCKLVRDVTEQPDVDMVELNISCPNVESGHIFGTDPAETERLLEAVRETTEKPLIAKLTPEADDVAAVGLAAERGGADGLSLINTVKETVALHEGVGQALGAGSGGISGPVIKPTALSLVGEVTGIVDIPVIGMGGICNGRDAREFLDRGCTCVAVGTENFRNPLAGKLILVELKELISGF